MSSDKATISLAQVFEMQSGEWINDPFMAVVGNIENKVGKPPACKKFWNVILNDTTGSASVKMTLFYAPKFKAGDQIEISGQGIKFEDGQWGKQVKVGDKAEIHVLGTSVHHQEQVERKAESKPAISGQTFPVMGVTVGMAINNAMTLLTSKLTHDEMVGRIITPVFWSSVHEVASDIIRISRVLESGKLAPSVRERTGETVQQVAQPARTVTPPPAARSVQPPDRPMATPNRQPNRPADEQLANQDEGADQDVPF
jgi:hypothetical protein